jgi:hypothetical protein
MVLIIYDDCTIVNLEKLCSAYKHKVKALGSAYPRAFVVLIVTVSAVQPLANIVGNYTCYDREDKGNYVVHINTPFPLSDWAVTT